MLKAKLVHVLYVPPRGIQESIRVVAKERGVEELLGGLCERHTLASAGGAITLLYLRRARGMHQAVNVPLTRAFGAISVGPGVEITGSGVIAQMRRLNARGEEVSEAEDGAWQMVDMVATERMAWGRLIHLLNDARLSLVRSGETP